MKNIRRIYQMDANLLTEAVVLLRLDLNLPLDEQGQVNDFTRLHTAIPTIKYLITRYRCKIVVLSHFRRPQTPHDKQFSLRGVFEQVRDILHLQGYVGKMRFSDYQTANFSEMEPCDIWFCENTRFYGGERSNDAKFCQDIIAKTGASVYVNDAFSSSHLAHASVLGMAKALPSCAGFGLIYELEQLEILLRSDVRKPLYACIGGAKMSTKLHLLYNLIQRCSHLMLSGGIAHTFLYAQGVECGQSLYDPDLLETAVDISKQASESGCALYTPVDALLEDDKGALETAPINAIKMNQRIVDIGPKTTELYKSLLLPGTLVWNGPLGIFERDACKKGTCSFIQHVVDQTRMGNIVSIAGGGETVACINKMELADGFRYVSSGGGAFLEWLSDRPLPGIKALCD